jgi:hypothetical protein
MNIPLQVSTVIVGSWNPKIFTPLWIKTNLFRLTTQQEIQGMVNFEEMDFGFQYDGIQLLPKSNLVEINVEKYDDEKGMYVSSLVIKLLELLPQTPIKALGVNIRYAISRQSSSSFVKEINGIKCNFGEFELNQIKQSVDRSTYQVNIISDITKDDLLTTFNFHYSKLAPFDPKFINLHYVESQNILDNGK